MTQRESLRTSVGGAAARLAVACLLLAPSASPAHASIRLGATPPRVAPNTRSTNAVGVDVSRGTRLLLKNMKVPSFSRQTGLACGACHFQFPQLTPFGRMFKLNGYTMTGLKTVQSGGDSAARQTLSLSPIPTLSGMIVASVSHIGKTPANTQNAGASFPQEASLFLAGGITPKIGGFIQYTYSGSEAKFAVDNLDIRFASHRQVASRDLLYGVTLHNNPGIQDVWNTVPAWSWPFMESEQTPGSITAPILAGALGQSVLGLGTYGLWNQTFYAEVSAYRSAQQGVALPLDGSTTGALERLAPYWRLAVTRDLGAGHLTVGTYGIDSHLFGHGVSGPTDRYTDIAADAQYESHVAGDRVVILRSSYIHERRTLAAMYTEHTAESIKQNLNTMQASLAYQPSVTYSATLGFFSTTGTADPTLYAAADVTGSEVGKPNTNGFTGEVVVNPWQNTRFALQYRGFTKFNGSSANYDGSGRRARDNNTLYLYTWMAF
jgi:hypothetical protein